MGERYLRAKQVIEILGIKKTKLWENVRSGQYPQPLRHLGPRTTVWRESDILDLAEGRWKGGADHGH